MLGQVIALACVPLISRVYTPAEVGAFAVILAVSSAAGVAAAWRLDLAVSLPTDDEEAREVARLGIAASLMTASALTLVAAVLILTGVETPTGAWLISVGPVAGLYGTFLVLNQVALRAMKFRWVGFRNILNVGVGVVAQVLFGAFGWGLAGLVTGAALGQLLGVILLSRGTQRPLARFSKPALRRFRSFPLILAPSALINALGLYLPAILIAFLFGPIPAGLFALAQRLLAAPVTLIGAAVSQVLIAKLGSEVRSGGPNARRMFHRVSRALTACSFVLTPAAIGAGLWLVEPLLGPAWLGSGGVLIAMTPAVAAQLVASPVSIVLILLERTRTVLVWDISRACLIVAALGGAKTVGLDFVGSLWVLSAVNVLAYIAIWLLSADALRTQVTPSSPTNNQYRSDSLP